MYIFFIRHFNDIDHMSPVVWRMHQEHYPVAVYCMNQEYDIRSDYRLNFLKKCGIKVNYIYSEYDQGLGLPYRILRFLFIQLNAFNRSSLFTEGGKSNIIRSSVSKLTRKIEKRLYRYVQKRYYGLNWARNFIKMTNAKVLCFDWIETYKFVVDPLLLAAQEYSIPAISLPHGVFLYTNEDIKIGATQEMRFEKFHRFDRTAVQNPLRKEVIARSGVPRDQLVVLGSARYCDEWMGQNKKIIPRKMPSKIGTNKKVKVVLMTTRPRYRINVDRMIKTFDVLSKIDGLEVVIKPHTRTGGEAYMYKNANLSEVSDLSSVELCEWADVIMVIASSIIIEALKQRKPALYLKYLHENTMEYEEFKACWIINSEEELIDALATLQNNPGTVPYKEDDVNRWLSEIIFGGRANRDVLNDYQNFILNCSKN
jgi:hypothetical protein